jgi:hypothetical protein
MIRRQWPQWWDWELELSPPLFKRMVDRGFTEMELRTMLEHARGYRPDIVAGRWVVITLHHRQTWEIIVEPDFVNKSLIVITAYPYWE